ncbi:MAG: hypothetical protein U1A77_19220 [Pirellulales bacterium]
MQTPRVSPQRAVGALTKLRAFSAIVGTVASVFIASAPGSSANVWAQASDLAPNSAATAPTPTTPTPTTPTPTTPAPTTPAPTNQGPLRSDGTASPSPRAIGLPVSPQPARGRLPLGQGAGGQASIGQLPLGQQAPGQQAPGGKTSDPNMDVVPVMVLEQFLFRKDVMSELGLIDEQIDNLTQRLRSAQQQLNLASRLTPGVQPNIQQMQEKMVRIHVQTHRDVENELLPHQRIRMRQLAIQMRYPGGNLRVFTSPEFISNLEYTPDQEAAIKAQQEATEKELQQAVERIMAEGRARIQRVMTAEQRAKSEEMLGAPFVFVRETQDEFRNRMRRR